MSNNGNGGRDDDIDELVRSLNDTNRNLEDLTSKVDTLVNSIIQGAREQQEGVEDDERFDLWRTGKISPGKAHGPESYIRLRRQTARSEEASVPQISKDVRGLASFFIEVYRMSGEHLQRIYFALNNEQWKDFVQKLAIMYGAERQLVDILNPGPTIFGITVTDKEVTVLETATHMNFTKTYGNFWFGQSLSLEAKKYSDPSSALQLPEDPDSLFIEGSLAPRSINEKLAKAIDDRGGMSLPDKFKGLL